MKLIRKYIVGDFVFIFLAALFIITFVFSLGAIFKITGLIAKGASARPILKIFFSGMPAALAMAIPLASLISTLLLFGRLSSDGEIAAMRACGISIVNISSGPIFFAMLLTAVCIFIHNEIAPRAHFNQRKIMSGMTLKSPLDLIEEGRFMSDFIPGLTLYVEKRVKDSLKGVRIYDHRDPELHREITAATGTVRTSGSGQNMIIDLHNVTITPFAKDRPDSAQIDFWPLTFPLVAPKVNYEPKDDDLPFGELLTRMNDIRSFYPHLRKEDLAVARMKTAVELNKRLSLSFSCLAFVILGIPLGIKAHRKESSIGIGMSLLVVFNFYIFIVLAESLQKVPACRADIIVWIPVLLSVLLGARLLYRAD